MNGDSLKVANKIISYEDLAEIFAKMYEELEKYKKISRIEEAQNRMLDYNYQVWTFKDNSSSLHFSIDFYDGTEIKFDSYHNFIAAFNNRLEEIKHIYVRYSLNYSVSSPSGRNEWYNESITMWIYEKKAEITLSIRHDDNKMDEVYNLIKNKIQNAPVKYDDVIKRKSSISSTIGFALAMILSLIFCTLLLFIPSLRTILSASCVLYPIICLMVAFVLSSTLASWKLDDLYKNIVPDKKYISYEKGYKDDIDDYLEKSEVLIGNNAHNMEKRKQIMEEYNKYKKFIPIEVGILVLLSIVTILIGKM